MNTTEKQIEKPSIVLILEEMDSRLDHLSQLTNGLIGKGHQLKDTSEPQQACDNKAVESTYSLEEILKNQNARLYYINQDLETLLNKLNGLF